MNYSNIVPYKWVSSSTVTNTITRHLTLGSITEAAVTKHPRQVLPQLSLQRTQGVYTITVLNNQGNKITMAAFTKELKQYIYFNQAYTSGHSRPPLQQQTFLRST